MDKYDYVVTTFYNPMYTPYESSAYAVYFSDTGSIYLVTETEVILVMDQINFKINDDIDTYMAARGFDKAVDVFYRNDPFEKFAKWYPNYDDDESKRKLKSAMSFMSHKISDQYRYNIHKNDNLINIYGYACAFSGLF